MTSIVNKVKDAVGVNKHNNNNNNNYAENQPASEQTSNYGHPSHQPMSSNQTTASDYGQSSHVSDFGHPHTGQTSNLNNQTVPSTTNTTTNSTTRTGPVHHHETLNKIDPRVHENTQRSSTAVDPTDAARVPPSVLQQHVDGVHVQHDYPHDSTAKRHSVSHQEAHLLR